MILFKTDNFEIDLSNQGVSLNEESNLFSDNIYKSYSLPFAIKADDDLLLKLGIPNLDNITNVASQIPGKLILPNNYYNAVLFLGEVQGEIIECDLSYGDEELSVYDMELKNLPWPIVLTPDVVDYANETVNKSWPETAFNFPMVYNPSIKEKENYDAFENFMNKYDFGGFVRNSMAGSGETTTYFNKNVMAPFPYLLEILRFGFSLEGKTIKGPVVENELFRKVLCITDNYLEKFRGSEFQTFSFTVPDETTQDTFIDYGIYNRQFTVDKDGTYNIKFKISLDSVIASPFELEIYQEDPNTGSTIQHYLARSSRNRVDLEEEVSINIAPGQIYDYIKIRLKLPYTAQSIASGNKFEFIFKDGQLNEFPSYFSLSEFMPDLTFGEFVNEIKNWLNLDIEIGDAEVNIDFTQNSVLNKHREPHKHLEITTPRKTHNTNRLYKLSYANGERVHYNRNGQIYSDLEEKGIKEMTIEMDVQPLHVEENGKVVTGVMPEEKAKINFAIFEGLINNRPVCSTRTYELNLQNVFLNYWETWLRYRIFSKTFKESFECSVHERINLNELSHKYNELHVIKKLQRKFISGSVMRVEIESETF